MKKYDEVVLKPEFKNPRIYVIADLKQKGGEMIASLFPKAGGITVSAGVQNLEVVCDG